MGALLFSICSRDLISFSASILFELFVATAVGSMTMLCVLYVLYSKCSRNPVDEIAKRVTEMGDLFCEKFVQVGVLHY